MRLEILNEKMLSVILYSVSYVDIMKVTYILYCTVFKNKSYDLFNNFPAIKQIVI